MEVLAVADNLRLRLSKHCFRQRWWSWFCCLFQTHPLPLSIFLPSRSNQRSPLSFIRFRPRLFFFFFLFLIPRALYMYSISGFRGFLYWKNEYQLPQTTFFSCVLRCVLDCLMSHFFATRFRVSCLLQLVNWMKNLSWICHEFLYFCFIFYSDFFRILSRIICSNLQYFEVLSFTFVFCTNPLLLLYSIKHILKVQAELNSLSSRLEGGVCFHLLCLLLLLYL